MKIDRYGISRKLINTIKNSYGPSGKSTVISHEQGSFQTRDGLEIISAIDLAGKNPFVDEVKNIAEFAESYAGDGTTSSLLAFLYAVNMAPLRQVSSESFDESRKIAFDAIENISIPITEESVIDFVRTTASKTLSTRTVYELSSLLFNEKFNKGQYIYVTDKLYSKASDAMHLQEIYIENTSGFSFDCHSVQKITRLLENQTSNNWFVCVCRQAITKDTFIYMENYFKNQKDNMLVPDESKLLVIGLSINHELDDYFSKKHESTISVFPIAMSRQTLDHAGKMLNAMMHVVGTTHSCDDLIHRLSIMNKWVSGVNIDEELNQLHISEHGTKYTGTCESVSDYIKNNPKIKSMNDKDASNNCTRHIMGVLNKSISDVTIACHVNEVIFSGNTVSISGFRSQNKNVVTLHREKNLEKMHKCIDNIEKNLCKRIDIIYSMCGVSKIMVLDCVSNSRANEILGSLNDVISAFNSMLRNKKTFCLGACITTNIIVERLRKNLTYNNFLLSNVLEHLIHEFNISMANQPESDKSMLRILDSSLTQMCIVNSAIKGLVYASSVETEVVGINYDI